MKVCIITPLFGIAGVPLAQIRTACAFVDKGHDVDLIFGNIDSKFKIPDVKGVNVYNLNKNNARGMLIPIWRFLRTNRPDVVLSAEDHLTIIVLIAAIFSRSKAKISGSSRVIPSDRLAYSEKLFSKGWFLKQVMKSVMWRANALTCVSKDMVGHYRKIFKKAPHVNVYNIILDKKSFPRMKMPVKHNWLANKEYPVVITAGTMTKRKGFADLINAVKILSTKRKVRLIILGDGYLRNELESLVNELELSEWVEMPGNVENVLKYFALADVFVLSSYAEGLPNVLIEAMICGCTPVATDCPTGPSEILKDGTYGFLIPMHNPGKMATAIDKAIDSPVSKTFLSEAVKPFSEDAVIKRHFEVLGINDSDYDINSNK